MDQILYCVHDKCNSQSRLIQSLSEVPKHSDKNHTLIQFKDFKLYVNQKFIDADVKQMEKIVNEEKKLKDSITKLIKTLKEQLDLFEINEVKKMPSLEQILNYVWSVKKTENTKEISADLVKGVVEFQLEKIQKYGTVYQSIDSKMNSIKSELSNMLKPSNLDLAVSILQHQKFQWSDNLKADIYLVSTDKKTVQAQTSFIGYSFACVGQNMSKGARYEIKLEITEVESKGLSQSQLVDKKKSGNFAIGLTHQKTRNLKGFDSQDLSMVGHGFYIIRSDGWVCHNSDKNINWKQGIAFTPEFGIISLKFDATEGDFTIEQGKNKYLFKADKVPMDSYLFCVHLKQCKARIID